MAISMIWSGGIIGGLILLFIGWKMGSFLLKVFSLILIAGLLLALFLFGFIDM